MGQNQGEGGFVPFVPEVSSVSEKKLDAQPEPTQPTTERPEPQDTGISSPTIPRSTPAATATDPNKPAEEFRTTPEPDLTKPRALNRLARDARAVLAQLLEDRATAFTLEYFDLGVPAKITSRRVNFESLEQVIKTALEKAPTAERCIIWSHQPDGWEVGCAQYSDLEPRAKRVQA
jgi:hypothetical protein